MRGDGTLDEARVPCSGATRAEILDDAVAKGRIVFGEDAVLFVESFTMRPGLRSGTGEVVSWEADVEVRCARPAPAGVIT